MEDNNQRSRDEVARRLTLLIRAVGSGAGSDQSEFAKRCGLELRKINNMASGSTGLDIESALAIAHATGASLDWLFRGSSVAMPDDLMDKITRARDAG